MDSVPLVALSCQTKEVISMLLNPPKHLPCENGLPRDWRGLACLAELDGRLVPMLSSQADPTAKLLTIIEEKIEKFSIRDLCIMLEKIDRWDILDDAEKLFETDVKIYLERSERSKQSAEIINDVDAKNLTVDDVYRYREGLDYQHYDAFLLYADEDIDFAKEIMENLEQKQNLKLCVKDRDLIASVSFEHEGIMTLISERCNKLIVLLSPDFMKSSANKFFFNYAQALSIETRMHKIIPCLYKKCELPSQLRYMFTLDYDRMKMFDFWGVLSKSVQSGSAAYDDSNSVTEIKKVPEVMCEGNKNVEDSKGTNEFPLSKVQNEKTRSIETSFTNSSDDLKKSTSAILQGVHKTKSFNHCNKKCTSIWKWVKKKKYKNDKTEVSQDYASIMDSITIDSLPTTKSLDAISKDLINDEDKKQQQKKKKSDKYTKKGKKTNSKKVLVNA